MAGLKAIQVRLRAIVGQGHFIRRDTSLRALFASDARARMDAKTYENTARKLREAGFMIQEMDTYLLIDWPHAGYAAFFDQLLANAPAQATQTAHGLARIYARHEGAFTPGMLDDARLALRRWDAGQTQALVIQAGEQLAISLRTKQPVPSYYLPLLLTIEGGQA